MKIVTDTSVSEIFGVELTRRNLEALLAKLDEPDSVRTLMHLVTVNGRTGPFIVTAVENEDHYADRPAGRMSDETESKISKPETGTSW